MPPSAISQPTPRQVGSMSVAEYPWLAQPCPRITSELASVVQRNAHRYPNRSRRLVGMMSADGRCVAATTMIPAARPRATRSRTSPTNSFCCLASPTVAEKYANSSKTTSTTGTPEVRVIFPPAGLQQLVVPFVHCGLKAPEQLDRLGDVRANERLRAGAPQPEFDPLAVDEDQPAVGRERRVRDDQVQPDRLARTRLAGGEQVPSG